MDVFLHQKEQCLRRADQSRQGKIDTLIRPLVSLINGSPDFYTTSSCSGRVMVLARGRRKCDTRWLYVTHSRASMARIRRLAGELPNQPCWLRQESFIIHVCARSLKDANSLLSAAQRCGFKHSGIISAGRRIMVEMEGNEMLDAPISDRGRLLAEETYISYLVKAANGKMAINRKKLDRFYEMLKEQLEKKEWSLPQ